MLHDHVTGRLCTPLARMVEGQARFEVWDSPLSEAGVLGFDYGYSQDYPDGLVIWQASTAGPSKDQRVDRSSFERMLDEYYELVGWDKETGIPSDEKLSELGIEKIVY